MVESKYSGYESYSYLRAGADYPGFELDVEIGRVPGHELGLGPAEHERAERLLAESIVISLHDHPAIFPKDMSRVRDYIRTAREHTGFRGLAASGMTAVFDNLMDGTACVTSKFGWKWDDVIYDLGMRLSDLAHQDFVEVDRIDVLYGFGVRQMGIAYSESNTLGSGLKEPGDGGLTLFGRRAVERMNRLGMAIDVSHSSDRTCMDTFEASAKPVLITHAGARAVWDSPRMKPDEVLIGCAQSGGVIGIEAAPHTTLTKQHRAHSIESVMEHFEYCANLMGLDHVTFGPDTLFGDHVGLHKEFSDNLGIAAQIEHGPHFDHVAYVDGLENPSENYHNIVGWLVKHGYSDGDIQTVIGGNILRALGKIW